MQDASVGQQMCEERVVAAEVVVESPAAVIVVCEAVERRRFGLDNDDGA